MLGITPQLLSGAGVGWVMEHHDDQENNLFISSVTVDDQYLNDSPNSSGEVLLKNSDFSDVHCHRGDDHDHHVHVDKTAKKINHNAIERNRRRKINTMFSTLRSLLPSHDQSKKLSIPATLSRVLKYIPELREEVERLGEKKETLIMRTKICRQEQDQDIDGFRTRAVPEASLSSVSTTQISDEQIVVQISVPKFDKDNNFLSEALMHLEMEGFLVLSASCIEPLQGRLFCNLHLQAQEGEVKNVDVLLKEKVLSFFQKVKKEEE
ncbi:Transcription factor ORG2 [Sesamum alatum]|uniref:Transcription factor ORG2 n=1 Tax=Sesamum alatum TaxID=300844 RepID=A0AAE2CS02_9LAMI|nr:Transcription factor ORG2 [Sesamum alatum]